MGGELWHQLGSPPIGATLYVKGMKGKRVIKNENLYYSIDNITNCWNFKRTCIDKKGYASFVINKKRIRASRYFYEKYRESIDSHMVIDHLCRNRGCVNPAHLETVTYKENIHRGLLTKLSDWDVQKIRDLYKVHIYNQTQIGNLFGVGQDWISRIVNGKAR